jgi:membrane-bound lytic murein transglycosylase D
MVNTELTVTSNKLSWSMKNHRIKNFFLLLFPMLMVLCGFAAGADTITETQTFPVYGSLRPNVSFWKKIYTHYSTTQGVIHDKQNLAIIYDVIELQDLNRHGSRKINQNRIKKAKKKYKLILAKLAQGIPPEEPEEKRVADLFGTKAQQSDFRSAMDNLRCQVGQKDRFRQGIIRSGAYLAQIKQIFRDAGLPTELSYLPHVESSFKPKVYSKFGAAGIWQFTRSTGKRFMTVSYTVDERLDPIISSYAAAQLLKQNFMELQNWPMAITAYNHGISGMLRAKRHKGSYEAIFKEYRSRTFKFASRNFYSEFLAAIEVVQNYQQYFGELALDTPLKTHEVEMAGYCSLPEISRQLKLELGALAELNPALRNPVIRGQKYVPKGFRLRLPVQAGRDWEVVIAKLAPKIYKNFQKRSQIYTVQIGDTAGEIARMHGVKLRDLIAANNLNSRATIYVNQNLRIPLPDKKPITVARNEPLRAKAQSIVKSPNLPSTEAQSLTNPSDDLMLTMNKTAEPEEIIEKTVSDASLSQLAQTNPESQSSPDLASKKEYDSGETNKAESQLVDPSKGEARKEERLLPVSQGIDRVDDQEALESQVYIRMPEKPETAIPQESDIEAAKPAIQAPEINPEIIEGNLAIEHIWYDQGKPVGTIQVEVEETIGHYAEWLEVSAQEIRKLNGLRFGKDIRINDSIIIPLRRVTKEVFEERRFEFHKEIAEDFFASFRIEKVQTYTVRRGDNIWTLSKEKFEVPLWLIKKYNTHLNLSALYPSQQLFIPIIE